VDVADRTAVADAAKEAGPVDVLINNAGIVTGADLLDTTDEAIIRTFDVNTLALYWTTRAFLPAMRERDRGVIVTVSSAAGIAGVAKQTDYSASKFAAFGFTESLRNELRARGSAVSTVLVAPYYINTGMFDGVTTTFPRLLPILDEDDVARRIRDATSSAPAAARPPRCWSPPPTPTRACATASPRSSRAFCPSSTRTTSPAASSTPSNPGPSS